MPSGRKEPVAVLAFDELSLLSTSCGEKQCVDSLIVPIFCCKIFCCKIFCRKIFFCVCAELELENKIR